MAVVMEVVVVVNKAAAETVVKTGWVVVVAMGKAAVDDLHEWQCHCCRCCRRCHRRCRCCH
jgi:hypothetical protein